MDEITENLGEEIPDKAAEEAAQEERCKGCEAAELSGRVKALEEENRALAESVGLLRALPQFSVKSKTEKDGFSSIRAAFRRK